MTCEEFNLKYQPFLENGFYGLEIDNPTITEWLDKKFEQFTSNPEFTYSQIKSKFGMGRFYCSGLSYEEIDEVEAYITNFYKPK